MPADQYNKAVDLFTEGLLRRCNSILQNAGKELHKRLGEVTPYYTGRARASWNFDADAPNLLPAPELPFHVVDPFHLTAEELAKANAFYDPIYESKHAFQIGPNVRVVVISNNVPYIKLLNMGSSRQAPAMFFEATVLGIENLMNS